MKIKVYVIHTGRVKVDRAVPYKEKNPFATLGLFRSKDKKIELPVSCYLIDHPKGKILVDTGWNSKLAKEKIKRFCGIVDKVSHPIIKDGESVDCKLEKLGIKTSEIDYVILSHLDLDHASGLDLVKDAKKILVSNEELEDSKKNSFRYDKNNWKNVELTTFSFNENGIGPVGKSYDLFGDGTVILVNTPGHTHGHTSVIVKNNEKYIIIAGDCVYTHKSWQENKIPGFTVDKKFAWKSLNWIKENIKNNNCIEVLPNHDFQINEHIIEL